MIAPPAPNAAAGVGLVIPPRIDPNTATIKTSAVESNHSGFQGKGFVNFSAASGAYIEWEIGVETTAGATALTRMPWGASSIARCWVRECRPALAIE